MVVVFEKAAGACCFMNAKAHAPSHDLRAHHSPGSEKRRPSPCRESIGNPAMAMIGNGRKSGFEVSVSIVCEDVECSIAPPCGGLEADNQLRFGAA